MYFTQRVVSDDLEGGPPHSEAVCTTTPLVQPLLWMQVVLLQDMIVVVGVCAATVASRYIISIASRLAATLNRRLDVVID